MEKNVKQKKPIPNEFALETPYYHYFWVLIILAIVIGTFAFWGLGRSKLSIKLLVVAVTTAPVLYFAFNFRRGAAQDGNAFAAARDGYYVAFWRMNKQESDSYRKHALRKQFRLSLWLIGLPWFLGILGAILVTLWNLFDGVSIGHCMKMGGAIAAFVSIGAGGALMFSWVWRIPARTAMNRESLHVLFLSNGVFAVDQKAVFSDWQFRRELNRIERDGQPWFSIKLFDFRKFYGGTSIIPGKVIEFPIPAEGLNEVDQIAELLRHNS